MKKQEISATYNEYIAEIMNEGFTLNMTDLRGGYGFFGQQTCFSKGNEYVVIWIEREVDFDSDIAEIHCYTARFAVKPGETIDNPNYTWPRQWKEHLVSDVVFYELVRDEWFTDSEEEANKARAKRLNRWRSNRNRSERFELAVTDNLVKTVRRLEGFKTIKRNDIKVERVSRGYIVTNKRSNNQVAVEF